MPFVQAKCINCGGILAVDNCLEAAICPFCNTPYVVEKAINNYNITNNINVSDGGVVNIIDNSHDDRETKLINHTKIAIKNHKYYDGSLALTEYLLKNPYNEKIIDVFLDLHIEYVKDFINKIDSIDKKSVYTCYNNKGYIISNKKYNDLLIKHINRSIYGTDEYYPDKRDHTKFDYKKRNFCESFFKKSFKDIGFDRNFGIKGSVEMHKLVDYCDNDVLKKKRKSYYTLRKELASKSLTVAKSLIEEYNENHQPRKFLGIAIGKDDTINITKDGMNTFYPDRCKPIFLDSNRVIVR